MSEIYNLNSSVQPEDNIGALTTSDYEFLFSNMITGFALHEVITDENQNPIDYRYLAVNPEFERLTGLKAENIIGKCVKNILPGIEEYWIKIFGNVALTGNPTQFENYIAELNKYYEVRAYSPGFGKFAVLFFDITERINNEARIKHLNLILASIRNVNQLIVQETSKTELLKKTCNLLTHLRGYDHAYIALLDKELNFIDIASSGNDIATETIKANFRRKILTPCQKKALSKSGVQIVADVESDCTDCFLNKKNSQKGRFTIKLFHSGKTFGILSVMLDRMYINDQDEKSLFEEVANDISYALHKFDLQDEKLRAENNLKIMVRELIRAKDDADKANKLKSEFLAQMSHEIRSPLNIILNYTNFIKLELEEGNFNTSSDLKGSFESIEIAGNRIIRTINMILNISELQTGSYETVYRNINLKKDILDPILSQYKVNARSKNIDFDFHYDILPTIYGDEYSIGQIFSNLIDNAIKYTNEGFVKLKVFESHEKNIIVRIADSGIGISEEYLEKIFEPFSQEEQGYSRSYDGNGLGLALVKRYCKINNAEIDVISEKGKGSSFQITFNGLE
ncbi:hypothetical protein APF79_06820 [bacterium BRH_c32]|nr:MAG: hypothetical protein APF79_06820 [bacterium BRH_c32]